MKNYKYKIIFPFLLVILFFTFAPKAHATTGCAGTGACYYYTTTATSNNWSDTTKWYTGSGGTGTNGSVPTSADNVIFDSGTYTNSYTITVDATANTKDLTFSNPATGSPTLAGASAINIYGSLVAVSGMTWSHTSNLRFSATSGTKTVTTNGVTIYSQFTMNGPGSTVKLLDNYKDSGSPYAFYASGGGTFDPNGKDFIVLDSASPIIQTDQSFYNLTRTGAVSKTSGLILYSNVPVTNNLTINGSDQTVTLGGALTVSNGEMAIPWPKAAVARLISLPVFTSLFTE